MESNGDHASGRRASLEPLPTGSSSRPASSETSPWRRTISGIRDGRRRNGRFRSSLPGTTPSSIRPTEPRFRCSHSHRGRTLSWPFLPSLTAACRVPDSVMNPLSSAQGARTRVARSARDALSLYLAVEVICAAFGTRITFAQGCGELLHRVAEHGAAGGIADQGGHEVPGLFERDVRWEWRDLGSVRKARRQGRSASASSQEH